MNAIRNSILALTLSAAGFVAIVAREGYSDNAIIPTKGDVPTLGFGSTTGVKMGDKTTPQRALARAALELDTVYEKAVKQCVKSPLFQNEYDAYVSLTYNIGTGAFCGSTLVKKLNALDYAGACNQIPAWKMYQGIDCSKPNRVCGGLWKDRIALQAQCLATPS